MLYLGLLKPEPQRAEFHLEYIKNEEGGSILYSLERDIKKVCTMIRENEFANNVLIKNLGCCLPVDKITVYLEKRVYHGIKEIIIFINYAIWHSRDCLHESPDNIVILLERGLWSKYLALYISVKGLKVIECFSVVNSYFIDSLFKLRLNYSLQSTISFIKKSRFKFWNKEKVITDKIISNRNNLPFFSAFYTGRKITLDPKEKSDFFWLIRSNIPFIKNTLLYRYVL